MAARHGVALDELVPTKVPRLSIHKKGFSEFAVEPLQRIAVAPLQWLCLLPEFLQCSRLLYRFALWLRIMKI